MRGRSQDEITNPHFKNEVYIIRSLTVSISGKVLDIVDNVVEDKDDANRPKFVGLCMITTFAVIKALVELFLP